jgi:hypothetical protein
VRRSDTPLGVNQISTGVFVENTQAIPLDNMILSGNAVAFSVQLVDVTIRGNFVVVSPKMVQQVVNTAQPNNVVQLRRSQPESTEKQPEQKEQKRGRGRPKLERDAEGNIIHPKGKKRRAKGKKGPGRPKGSKNKPKGEEAKAVEAPKQEATQEAPKEAPKEAVKEAPKTVTHEAITLEPLTEDKAS